MLQHKQIMSDTGPKKDTDGLQSKLIDKAAMLFLEVKLGAHGLCG